MALKKSNSDLLQMITQKPLQSAKFSGILLTLVLGVAGFFRLIDAAAIIDDPLLGDGQFLAIILLPLASVLLICVVFLEALFTGYRLLRSDTPIMDPFHDRRGYVVLRVGEAAIAMGGVTIIITALPTLFSDQTPAPVGVGIMLLLMLVGIGILITSFVRSSAELFVYRDIS